MSVAADAFANVKRAETVLFNVGVFGSDCRQPMGAPACMWAVTPARRKRLPEGKDYLRMYMRSCFLKFEPHYRRLRVVAYPSLV